MGENKPPEGGEIRNADVRHEPGDVNSAFLTKFGIGMAFLIIVFLFGLYWLFDYFVQREAGLSAPPSRVTAKLPPEPRLQHHAARDMQEMRAAEDEAMQRYGWVDPAKGIVRIPVDRAMEIIAKKGLPVLPRAGTVPGEKKP